jgi:hypothetical protein
VLARTIYGLPQLRSIARFHGGEQEAGCFDGMSPNFTARRNDEHGRTRAVHEVRGV